MNRVGPLVVSVVGDSGVGKTVLIERLLRELSGSRYRVAVAKHCPHGFALDVEGKDSWRFTEAGARGVFLASPGRIGLIEDREPVPGLKSIAEHYFTDFDIVFGEGFSQEKEVASAYLHPTHQDLRLTGYQLEAQMAPVTDEVLFHSQRSHWKGGECIRQNGWNHY